MFTNSLANSFSPRVHELDAFPFARDIFRGGVLGLHCRHAALSVLRLHRADLHAELRPPGHLRVRPRGEPRHYLCVRAARRRLRVRRLHAPLLPRDRHRRRVKPAIPAHAYLVPRLRARLPDWRVVLLADRAHVRLHVQVVGVHLALE